MRIFKIILLKFIDIFPYIIFSVPSILILILARILKLFIHIRFGKVFSSRIGHFIFDIEYYLCQKKKFNIKTLDFFYLDNQGWPLKVRNKFLLKLVKRNIYSNHIVKYIIYFNKFFPDHINYEIKLVQDEFKRSIDIKNIVNSSNTQLSFNDLENNKGKKFLKKFNLKENDKYVCLVVRDSEYLNKEFKGRNWNYHNYRDADIKTYFKACIYLANKGYKIFRMGKLVKESINDIHPNIIDYANSNYRSDFLDIWLLSNCYYCLSTNTGLDFVSRNNKIPIISTNFLPINDIYSDCNALIAPKKLYWNETNISLNLHEMIKYSYGTTDEYIQKNIRIVDLDENEILDCVIEMEKKLNKVKTKNQELQKKSDLFWNVFSKKVYGNYENYTVFKYAEIANFYLNYVEINNHESQK